MEILVKGKKSGGVSKENKTEWRNERRAKMLAKRGYKANQIEAMMYSKGNNIRGQHVRKWLKHGVSSKEMSLEGENL